MALGLIKLYLGLTVSTNVDPTTARWVATFADGTYNETENRYEFVPANFSDDAGDPATTFPDLTNGYYNLYINGSIQQGDLSSIIDIDGTDTLVINIDAFDPEDTVTPLALEFVEMDATSTPDSSIVDAPRS